MISMHAPHAGRRTTKWRWAIVLAAGAAALAANVALATTATRVLDLEFQLLAPAHVAVVTVMGIAAALGVYAWVARRTAAPFPRFRRIALWALALSFVPNLGMMVNPAASEVLGASVPGVLILMLAHVPPAAAALTAANVLARTEQQP